MWYLSVILAAAGGLVIGRLLNWLSGAMVKAMHEQWALENDTDQLLVQTPGLPSLIWKQKRPYSTWFSLRKVKPASFAMSIAAAIVLAGAAGAGLDVSHLVLAPVGLLLLLMLRIDAEHFLLPDVLVYALMWTGLVWSALYSPEPATVVLSVFATYVALYALCEGYSALRGIRMMGHGDYKLAAALAAWLQYPQIPMMVLMAAVVMIALWVVVYRKRAQSAMPFGPALIISASTLILANLLGS